MAIRTSCMTLTQFWFQTYAPHMELPDNIRKKIDWAVEHLSSEFEGQVGPDQIRQMVEDSTNRLVAQSTVLDNVPLLAHRFARERLKAITRSSPEGSDASRYPAGVQT